MSSNQEVEIRAMLSPAESKAIYRHLTATATYQGIRQLRDTYFCPKEVGSFDELEMTEVGSYSLRLRYSIEEGRETTELNVKVITQPNDHHAWQEHEVVLSSFEEAKAILQVMGFKAFFTLEKTRQVFTDGYITFNIEEIKDVGSAIEIEILTTPEKAEEAKQETLQALQALAPGLQPVPKSVTNMVMRQRARF